ncbi:MAG: XRE family transcriptional regulator [Chitinophagaceae bacterium]|nr:MAG: XRE family transcriptional regulator [Chitinophagaceae bacterium]
MTSPTLQILWSLLKIFSNRVKEDIDMRYLKAFGANLRKLIEARGMSVRACALTLELEPAQLGRIVRGTQNPSLKTLLHIATGLGLSPRDLLDFDFDSKK